jgi:hypothetical protein
VQTTSVPAPTGGINAKDALARMPETDAVLMENWFPEPDGVALRGGSASHATGLDGAVDTLMTYNVGTTQELWGITAGKIYEVTNAGAVGAAAVTGLGNSRFQHITMGTAGGYFLMAVNGADKLQAYTGSAWYVDGDGTGDITGVDTAGCININNFKNRVFLIEKDSLSAWYLPVASIAGAANELDLSGLFKLGGHLVTMVNWTVDNAAGIDDYAAFITSEGEVALYQGTDPGSASTWALVGTFRIGRPIGYRCAIKAAADILINTTDGVYPLSKALLTDRNQPTAALTDKITNLIKPDIRDHSTKFGWEAILYPFKNKLLVNVPSAEGAISHQWVMNTINGSWTKFTAWNANCFAVLQDTLYFGGNTIVYTADTGEDDSGANITADVQQAYSYFGNKGQVKKFTMARPIFLTTGDIVPALVLNTDFKDRVPVASPTYSTSATSLWDTSTWDVSSWALGDVLLTNWQSVSGVGHSGGIRVKVASAGLEVNWVSTDIVYEKGGVL